MGAHWAGSTPFSQVWPDTVPAAPSTPRTPSTLTTGRGFVALMDHLIDKRIIGPLGGWHRSPERCSDTPNWSGEFHQKAVPRHRQRQHNTKPVESIPTLR